MYYVLYFVDVNIQRTYLDLAVKSRERLMTISLISLCKHNSFINYIQIFSGITHHTDFVLMETFIP